MYENNTNATLIHNRHATAICTAPNPHKLLACKGKQERVAERWLSWFHRLRTGRNATAFTARLARTEPQMLCTAGTE
jgi:hypothetical protein